MIGGSVSILYLPHASAKKNFKKKLKKNKKNFKNSTANP
jgi:hypothetical protein